MDNPAPPVYNKDTMLKRRGFTLIELLVVISILMVLAAILAPSIAGISNYVHQVRCQANLDAVGKATGAYAAANESYYFAAKVVQGSTLLYYWGTKTTPIQTSTAPLTPYLKLDALLCPSLPWGEYVPESGMRKPTTTYGYNAFCLDPKGYGITGARKTRESIRDPGRLFVFVDAATTTFNAFQNYSIVDVPEPPQGMQRNPSTHFRHVGSMANALCADGHAASFDTEDEGMDDEGNLLSFVGKLNLPHYGQ